MLFRVSYFNFIFKKVITQAFDTLEVYHRFFFRENENVKIIINYLNKEEEQKFP